MSFLAPGFMIAAGIIAAGVVAIHFIVTREPKTVPLPTARFAPIRPVRARSRRVRPQDLLLMLLRVLVILAVGAALARPVLDPPRRDLARIILVDRSRAVADLGEAADSARELYMKGDAVVLFDSTAKVVRTGALDSLAALTRAPHRGRLSSALITALRTASHMRERADSLELAIISPFAAEEADRATESIRALWPGGVRLIRVTMRVDSAESVAVAFDGDAEDPLRVSLSNSQAAGDDDASNVRVVRGTPDAADSAWVASGDRALVHWPATHDAEAAAAAETLPVPWIVRAAPDTVGGLAARGVVVIAPFERWAEYDGSGSTRSTGSTGSAGLVGSAGSTESAASGAPDSADDVPADGAERAANGDAPAGMPANGDTSAASPRTAAPQVVARWVDGEPAAVEVPYGSGCIRTVAVPVPSRGDLVLRPRFRRLVAELTGRCGGAMVLEPLDSGRLAALAGPELGRYVAGTALPEPELIRSPWVPWLFGAALVFALTALLLRRRVAGGRTAVAEGADG